MGVCMLCVSFAGVSLANEVGQEFIDDFKNAENIAIGDFSEVEEGWNIDLKENWKGELDLEEDLFIGKTSAFEEDVLYLLAIEEESKIINKLVVEKVDGDIVLGDNDFELFLDDSVIATLNDYVASQGENDLNQYSFGNGKVYFTELETTEQIYPTKKDYLAVVALIGMVLVLMVSGLKAVWVSMKVKPIE